MEKVKSEKEPTKNPIMGVQTIEVIKVKVSSGAGTPKDPVRLVVQYWDKNGKLIGKEDPYIEEMNKIQKSINCQSAEYQIQKEQTVFDLLTSVSDSGKFAAIIYDLLRKYESPEEIELFLNQRRDNLDEAIDYLKSRDYPIEHKTG